MKLWEISAAAIAALVAISCESADNAEKQEMASVTVGTTQSGLRNTAQAVLRDAAGGFVGLAIFVDLGSTTLVTVSASLPATAGIDGIHGFHIHANDNPANGDGCLADPAQPANTHFVSADGHYNPGAATHGNHAGDMPALFFTTNGNAAASFVTERFGIAEVTGRAVILHAGADNFANIPVGAAANQYTANAADATTLTNNTGNAGNRIACGVIQ